jgi:hypothetical protein
VAVFCESMTKYTSARYGKRVRFFNVVRGGICIDHMDINVFST